jgi:phage terminase large subunit-like protein
MNIKEIEQKLLLLDNKLKYGRLFDYKPSAKQRDFHALGSTKRYRLLRAGNQLGKTTAGASEMAMHLTGIYPEWWIGRRYEHKINAWVGGKSGEAVRDSVQKLLMGDVGDYGTGMIPKDCIGETINGRGVMGALDYVMVKHVNGGWSSVKFKNYEQGREVWQSSTLDIVWFDEEPPEDIYAEGCTRIASKENGMVYITFTPLKGMTSVVRGFLQGNNPDCSDTNITLLDAEHLSDKQKEVILRNYSPHERQARANGIPMMGEGTVFQIAQEAISVERFELPKWYKIIGGIDFGWQHPTAAVRLAWNPDDDIIYVTHVYKKKEATPVIHTSALKAWGKLTFAWPHDGLAHDKGSGEQLAEIYRKEGLELLGERAQFPDHRGHGVEAGLTEMRMRMETGRLKVFSHLTEWFEEFRLYHYKDGKVVKEYDDLLCATRYAMMCIQDADTPIDKADYGKKKVKYRSGSWMSA